MASKLPPTFSLLWKNQCLKSVQYFHRTIVLIVKCDDPGHYLPFHFHLTALESSLHPQNCSQLQDGDVLVSWGRFPLSSHTNIFSDWILYRLQIFLDKVLMILFQPGPRCSLVRCVVVQKEYIAGKCSTVQLSAVECIAVQCIL